MYKPIDYASITELNLLYKQLDILPEWLEYVE